MKQRRCSLVLLLGVFGTGSHAGFVGTPPTPLLRNSDRRRRPSHTTLAVSKAASPNSGGGGSGAESPRRSLSKRRAPSIVRSRAVAAPAAAAARSSKTTNAASKEGPQEQQLIRKNAFRSNRRSGTSSSSSSFYFLENSLLSHALLTKEQEQDLGCAVQRAWQVREQLQQCLQDKKMRQQQQQQSLDRFVMDTDKEDNEEDDDEDYEDLSQLSVYGLGSYYEDEEFQKQQRLSWLASKEAQYQAQEGDKSSFLQYDYLDDDDLDWQHRLTDQDVVESLGLKGGLLELQSILSQGALARQTLISSNIRLVVSIAKRWAKQQKSANNIAQGASSLTGAYSGGWDRPSLDECIQEGILGLARAVDRFEPKRNLRFATYATWWITNSVRHCFQQSLTGSFRLPVQFHDTKSRYKTLLKKHFEMNGESPGLDVLGDELGISVSRLQLVLRLTRPLLSTDMYVRKGAAAGAGKSGAGINEDNNLAISDTLMDTELSPEERVELSFLRQSLESAMASELAPHERDVLRLRLGLDDGISRTAREVVQEYGDSHISISDVRAWEQRAYKKLRSPHTLSTYKLLTYLDLAGVDQSTMTLR